MRKYDFCQRIVIALCFLCISSLHCFAQTWQVRPLWEIDNRFKNPELQDTLWINEQKRFFIGGHWLAAHESVQKRLHLNTHHNHNWTWHLFNNPVAHRGQLFLDIPADDEYAPMIIRAPMLMNDTPYVFPRDDISAIEFHPEIAQKERNTLIYNIICICCFFFRSWYR
jgi:hypothetical protein